MAKKSKADAASSDKVNKTKASGRSTSSRSKKSVRGRKAPIAKVESEAVLMAATVFDPTDEQIQMRAYFISERRRRFALPGDANSDWLEAKRQLLSDTRH